MNVTEAIRKRRAIRKFTDQQVPDDAIQKLLKAGWLAPSPFNSQPWQFIVVKNKSTLSDLLPKAQHGKFLLEANVLLVVTVNKYAKIDGWLSKHDQHVYSGACAIENMWLTAVDLGLGACWVTLDQEEARLDLQIPDDYMLVGSLAVGYPNVFPGEHTGEDRRPFSEFVAYEKFGKMKDV